MTLAYYFAWHYGDGLRRAVGLAQNVILLPLHVFSLKELFQTLFSPWKQIVEEHPRELLSSESIKAFWYNLISRGIGAVMRIILILIGLVVVSVAACGAAVIVVGWVLAPILPFVFFFLGISLL